MRVFTNLRLGARVRWQAINREYSGEVVALDERGALVRLDDGRYSLLSTEETLQHIKPQKR